MSWLSEIIYPKFEYWREQKFPSHELKDAAIKLGEESGEVQAAIFKAAWAPSQKSHKKWLDKIDEEIGDAAMVLISICQIRNKDFLIIVLNRMVEKGVIDDEVRRNIISNYLGESWHND